VPLVIFSRGGTVRLPGLFFIRGESYRVALNTSTIYFSSGAFSAIAAATSSSRDGRNAPAISAPASE